MVVLNEIMVETLKEYIDTVNECKDIDIQWAAAQLAAAVDVILRIGEAENDTDS